MNGLMDSSDPYKLLLASASHEQQRRQSEMNNRMVGNVFLPAIEMRHNKPNAISLKRLQVIEQCIAAENKREAQLAMCKTEQERHQWTKKFHLQRVHEHDLIKALMIGAPTEVELEIVDVELPRRSIGATTGLRAQIPSPDRVFSKSAFTGGIPKAKPHARKKFVLPECQGSPSRKVPPNRPKPIEGAKTSPSWQPAKSVEAASRASPKLSRPISSRVVDSKMSSALANSPLKPKQTSAPKSAHVRGTTKLTEVSPVRSIKPLVLHHDVEDAKQPHLDQVICFEGATSFHEAQRIAAEAMKPTSDSIEISTQTTQREALACPIEDSQWARPIDRQDPSKSSLGVEISNGRRHTFPAISPISSPPDSSHSSLNHVPTLTVSEPVIILSDFEEVNVADPIQNGSNEESYDDEGFAESTEEATIEDKPAEVSDVVDVVEEVTAEVVTMADPEVPENIATSESDADLDQDIDTRRELVLLFEELIGQVEEAQRSLVRRESTYRSPRPTTAAKVSVFMCFLTCSYLATNLLINPTDATNEGSHADSVNISRPPGSPGVPHGAVPGSFEMRCAGRHAGHDPGPIRLVPGPKEPYGILFCDPRRRRVATEARGALFLPHSLALSDAGGDQQQSVSTRNVINDPCIHVFY